MLGGVGRLRDVVQVGLAAFLFVVVSLREFALVYWRCD
jgi:hypothetical protein